MTQKQIDAAKKTLPKFCDPGYNGLTPEQKRLSDELDCRSMINSCLCYGGIEDFWRECEWRIGDKSYAQQYVRDLGMKRVLELVAEQEADFAQAKVYQNVYTDSEGVSYNSIEWVDD